MKYSPVEGEKKILQFWKAKDTRQKAIKKNEGNKPFYFLDGPPYTSGKIHLGTAWNKSLKDFVTRYKRMKGFDVWDKAGYDMHGLPTEGKVQAKLGMKTKEDILEYGLAKFIKACEEFAVTNLQQMNKDFKQLGVWLDFDNAYQTIKNEYIEGAWWLVKRAHEKKRLYEGQMTMTWCGSCQTSLAKHELEYKNVVDKSIYVKLKTNDEYLVVWTTTPWTMPYNLGVMANPDIDYVKAQVGDEVWILAEDLVHIIKDKFGLEYEIIKKVKGKDLEGLKYEHPLKELKEHHEKLKKKAKKLHVVVMSEEYVTTEQGTGLVHMAPGAGPEDYEVGHREGIPAFNNVNEEGFYEDMGSMTGLHVKKDNDKFIEILKDSIVHEENYPHDYAHCWRCKNPVLYRTTTQWFFKVEDLIPKMRKLNKKKIYWVPEWAGANQFDSWLENLRDNGITRQRFWGSPLPVWRCEACEDYTVIESRKDLKKHDASHIPDDLHKPWIDEVTMPCKCGGTMHRIPDIMDVWIDAGVDSWASLGFPHDDTLFKKLFPADFITEGKDQIRGWFNLLFVASMLALEDISFERCYMTGFINDASGRKMSKSLGNVITPNEVTEKYGADTFRYYSIGGTNPGLDLNYNFDDIELKRRNLSILWNLHKYVIEMSRTLETNPRDVRPKLDYEEKYILSKLHSSIKKINELMDKYYLNEVPWVLEDLYMELSRTYIQMVREKANAGDDEEKESVLYTIYEVMINLLKLMAPITPFITEMMYQNFRDEFGLEEESIHLYDYPEANKSVIDQDLEEDVSFIKDIIQAGLGAREKAQTGIRWPLHKLIVETSDKNVKKALDHLKDMIKNQVNIKGIEVTEKFEEADTFVKPNYKTLGPEFGKDSQKIVKLLEEADSSDITEQLRKGKVNIGGFELEERHLEFENKLPDNYKEGIFPAGRVFLETTTDAELEKEGYTRELIRRIQSFRKEAGLKKRDTIQLYLELGDLKDLVSTDIANRVGASKIELKKPGEYNFEGEEEIKGHKFKAYLVHS